VKFGKGPAVGPTGINIKDVVDEINAQTMVFKGLTVPVRIECDPETKQFEIFIETPSTASLLLKEAGVEKGSSACSETKIGNLTLDQIINVVEAKKDKYLDKNFKNAVKSVLGTALSAGITVEGVDPREIQKRIENGEYDDKIKGEL
jgi:large subunit ribosomal protein L11